MKELLSIIESYKTWHGIIAAILINPLAEIGVDLLVDKNTAQWIHSALTALFTLLVIALLVTGVCAHSKLKESKRKEESERKSKNIKEKCRPDSELLRLASTQNLSPNEYEGEKIIGRFLEIAASPCITQKNLEADQRQWKKENIYFVRQDLPKERQAILKKLDKYVEKGPNDEKKFTLLCKPLIERQKCLELKIAENSYEYVRTAHHPISGSREDPDIATSKSLTLEKNRIPQSLCLHYTLVLKDAKRVLLMKTSKASDYHSGLWSATGGEQLEEADVSKANQDQIKNWFDRALQEEVFGKKRGQENQAGESDDNILEEIRDSYKVLALGLEYPICNPTILGLAIMRGTMEEFRAKLKDRTSGDEGCLATATFSQVKNLIEKGTHFIPSDLNGCEMKEEVTLDNLHPTTLARLYWVYQLFEMPQN